MKTIKYSELEKTSNIQFSMFDERSQKRVISEKTSVAQFESEEFDEEFTNFEEWENGNGDMIDRIDILTVKNNEIYLVVV